MRSHENTTGCRTVGGWPSIRPKHATYKGWLKNENHRFDLRTGYRAVAEILGRAARLHEDDKLGFVILMKGNAELMIQSTASMEKDNSEMAKLARPAACLYIEISDFDDLLKRLGSAPVVVPVRTTFYGMKEIGVREPGGNIVLFAAPVPKQTAPAH
jgi:hypothetical protein